MKSTKITLICQLCSKEFRIFRAWYRAGGAGKYCSRECARRTRIGTKSPLFARIKKNCLVCNKEFEIKRYRKDTAKFCSYKCLSVDRGRRMRGENHPFWKGGITDRGWMVKQWAKRVKERDGNKCVECGSNKKVQAHHIKDWKDYKKLRYDMNNGITLCVKCHASKHPNLKFILSHGYGNVIWETY